MRQLISTGSIVRTVSLAAMLIVVLACPIARAQSTECLTDLQGADDEPGQKDLNQFCDALGNNTPYELTARWNLDDTAWGGNNTGDACALFDTDGDHFANFALCVTVVGGPPAVIKAGTPKLYSCADSRPDRCVSSAPITSFASSCAVSQGTDPFSHSGNICKSTPGCRTTDTVVTCQLESNDLPGTESCVNNRCSNIPSQFCLGDGDCIPITDVCSYPSEQPNSDPSDCVITATGQDPCQGVSCSAFNTQCATASCNPQNGRCEIFTPRPAATSCTGTSNGGACDGTDHCSGSSDTCVDGFLPATTVCRASAGQCDVAETCSGASGACPANGFQSTTTTCIGTSNGGACDGTDLCNGAGQCVDGFQPSTSPCIGASNGRACDGPDHCSGTANTCVDAFEPTTTVCRPSAGPCDVTENCSGTSGTCPTDGFQPSTTACTGTSNGDVCDGTDLCDGAGQCRDAYRPSTTVCRAATGQCDIAESCTGTSGACPSDVLVSDGTTCNDGNACTLQDVCVDGECVGGNGPTSEPGCVFDTAGGDDATGQKDLTEFCQTTSATCSGTVLTWQWDDTGWSGNNTGDACALYDTDDDGFANYALCVTVGSSPASQLATSPRLYSCTDGKAFNCTNATLLTTRQSTCIVNTLVTDPFIGGRAANRCGGGNCLTRDTQAQCCVRSSDFPFATALIDVCSYPSQSPSSDPSECVKTVFCTNDNNCVVNNGEGACQGRCLTVDGVTQCVYAP